MSEVQQTENQDTPVVEVNGEPLPVEKEVNNLDGVLSTLQKYQKFGNLKEIEKAVEASQQLTALSAALQEDGFELATLPSKLKEITARSAKEEALEKELTERYEARIKLKDTEHHQALTAAEKRAAQAEQSLLNRKRSDQVRPLFAANAKEGASQEWGLYWEQISKYVEFEEGTDKIAKILKPNGDQAFVTVNNETKEATLTDLFAGIVQGDYGFTLANAMRPISSSTGGGLVNPATGTAATIKQSDLANLPPAELATVKQKLKRGEIRVIQ